MSHKSKQCRSSLGFGSDEYVMWVAIHEVGHALCSEVEGARVKAVQLTTDGDGVVGGVTESSRWQSQNRRAAIVSLPAGYVANGLWLRDVGLWTSYRDAVSRASSKRDFAYLDGLASAGEARNGADTAQRLLKDRWRSAVNAAERLARSGSLSGREFRSLI